MTKFETNANTAMWSLNLVQVTELISGFVVPLAMFICGLLFYKNDYRNVPGDERQNTELWDLFLHLPTNEEGDW